MCCNKPIWRGWASWNWPSFRPISGYSDNTLKTLVISCKSEHRRLSSGCVKCLESTIMSCSIKNRPEALYKQAKVALDSLETFCRNWMVENEKGISDILVDFEFGLDLPRWISEYIIEYVHFVTCKQIFMKKRISNQWEENNFNILFLKTSLTPFSLSTIQLNACVTYPLY